MNSLTNQLAGAWMLAAELLFIFWWVAAVALFVCAVSITRNVAKARRALERIADSSDARRGPGGGGVLGL